ncbi:Sec34-domain-containing protein [Laetiporus sulphureus 93-53]|uniref:Conserved oligomeric Golgi complex subunit 3 n=1 Tax=Laetiporus sulphureus 93-53 TaxID=1314785 RepID=A0A165D4A9_9APHY|nr:Sec34-domain-containing protein [Laetiporus sulphureus 93-53]KZT04128.1 Sec34-domain-containing protein [Laetiporus sulphureus 93-53]
MASGSSIKRANPLTSLTPHPKPTISVEEWEARAPLGELEMRSVNLVKAASEKAVVPSKFSPDEPGSSSRPSTPTLRVKLLAANGGSRPSTPTPTSDVARSGTAATHPLHPKQPIQTPQQFYDWFALIDRSVAHSQEAHFRAHLESVSGHLDTCDALVHRIDEVDAAIVDMLREWRIVEDGGKSLKEACEQLLEERDRLLSITEAIGERLEYFQELEHATRMLNSPGDSLVLQTDFIYMVERVDVCIDYLKAHRHFREAEIYLLRFQQCLTRAMTLIKMFFVGSLRALTVDITKRMSEKDVSATAQEHLLYTRFYTVSAQLAPLLSELERRATAHPEELSSLLSECHAAYFAARKGLLVNRLMEEIKGLDPIRTELVELTRAGCSYLKQLCTDEFNLFRAFFNSGEDQLYNYLENLCDYLYDDLRPRILHEPRLTALCEVCTVLQALMVLDVPTVSDSDEEDGEDADELNLELNPVSEWSTARKKPGKRGLRALQIGHLLQMVLQDAQTRLFFKAQAVIQSDVRYYVPKPEDLAYPEMLLEARKPASGMDIREKASVSELFQLKSFDRQDTWYPTLRKTVWVLSQLHDFVKPAIFADIAQEAVALCLQSLTSATTALRARRGALDGALFLVRHLLILKEMAQKLDLDLGGQDYGIAGRGELGGVTEALASVLGRTSALFPLPSALLTSLGMPRPGEETGDFKQGIDGELRRACEEVIAACSDPVSAPLRAWIERTQSSISNADTFPHTAPNPSQTQPSDSSSPSAVSTLSSTAAASPTSAAAAHSAFLTLCSTELRAAAGRVRLYIEDARTAGVLLGHVCERVVGAWEEWRLVVGESSKENDGREGTEVLGTAEQVRRTVWAACEEGANGSEHVGTSGNEKKTEGAGDIP